MTRENASTLLSAPNTGQRAYPPPVLGVAFCGVLALAA